MDLKFGDIQETALIPLAIKASETARPNARIKDIKAEEIIDTLELDSRLSFVSEKSYNEEMKKYSIRGKLFAIVGRNINNRLAVFKW
ncbi:MAG: hypothetical protein IJI23_05875 [Lachnospiraceae bacterium]|nr:hypothetical protein [Clostridia bacterium]MBQ6319293.1 hypothetical protein [Lachnospiraceae bacterium]